MVWLPWILFSHILGIIIPIDFHIFQRGSNHQPVRVVLWTMYIVFFGWVLDIIEISMISSNPQKSSHDVPLRLIAPPARLRRTASMTPRANAAASSTWPAWLRRMGRTGRSRTPAGGCRLLGGKGAGCFHVGWTKGNGSGSTWVYGCLMMFMVSIMFCHGVYSLTNITGIQVILPRNWMGFCNFQHEGRDL